MCKWYLLDLHGLHHWPLLPNFSLPFPNSKKALHVPKKPKMFFKSLKWYLLDLHGLHHWPLLPNYKLPFPICPSCVRYRERIGVCQCLVFHVTTGNALFFQCLLTNSADVFTNLSHEFIHEFFHESFSI